MLQTFPNHADTTDTWQGDLDPQPLLLRFRDRRPPAALAWAQLRKLLTAEGRRSFERRLRSWRRLVGGTAAGLMYTIKG